ncbi:MAG: DUF2975 domain-containing protein [Olivibacter sp.]|nr:DUF2975 domain-containing protein [Olivibacter sp. UJ_SKK_5.1]
MRKVKSLASYFRYISLFCAFVYVILAFYSAISLSTGWCLKVEGKYFYILLPFTQKTVLIGENSLAYIIFDFIMIFILYGIFFRMLSSFFKVFTQPKLFTVINIKHLRYFAFANLFIPSAATFLAYTFSTIDRDVIMLIILHFIIGVFSYFMAQIFKQGVNLQDEQDLII